MVDIYERRAQFKEIVISEIEGQNNEPDADDKISIDTLDLKQMYDVIVKKYDNIRGGTESLLFDASAIIFEESDVAATTRQWKKLCSARRQQRNLSTSIKTT